MDAADELEQLLNALVPFARGMLEKHGAFVPFGAVVDTDGDVRLVAADAGSESPSIDQVVAMLRDRLRVQAREGAIRACAVCADVRVNGDMGPIDAISVALEHATRDPLRVFVPYTVDDAGRAFGKPVAAPGERHIFDA